MRTDPPTHPKLREHGLPAVLSLVLAIAGFGIEGAAATSDPPGLSKLPPKLQLVDPIRDPDLFIWNDTCNVYVLRSQDSALLIDLGDGSVLDHLSEIGVRRVEWVYSLTTIANNAREHQGCVVRALKWLLPKLSRLYSSAPPTFANWT